MRTLSYLGAAAAALLLGTAKYARCRLKAESKFTKTSDAARLASDLTTCAGKLATAYNNAFTRWGGSCPAGPFRRAATGC